MGRPRDWGDRFPSDINDIVPNDRTSTLSERAVSPGLNQFTLPVNLNPVYTFTPDIQEDPVPEYPREVFIGIVLFELTTVSDFPRYYSTLLESGEVVTAGILTQGTTQNIEKAQTVIVVRGTNQNTWHIVGPLYWKDLYIIEVYTANESSTIGSDETLDVPTTGTRLTFGKTPEGIDPFEVHSADITVKDGGIYKIAYTVSLEGSGSTSLGSCVDIEGRLKIKKKGSSPGWLHLEANSAGGSVFGIAPNESPIADQKWRMPAFLPSGVKKGAHLYVNDKVSPCVELAWTKPGASGQIMWFSYNCSILGDGGCVLMTVTVEKGIITDWSANSQFTNSGPTFEDTPKTVTCSDAC